MNKKIVMLLIFVFVMSVSLVQAQRNYIPIKNNEDLGSEDISDVLERYKIENERIKKLPILERHDAFFNSTEHMAIEARKINSMPKNPLVEYKEASRFDVNRKDTYRIRLVGKNIKIPDDKVIFSAYKYGDSFFIYVHHANHGPTIVSGLQLLVEGSDKPFSLKRIREDVGGDGPDYYFEIARHDLDKLSNADNVFFRLDVQDFIHEEFKESWHGPTYQVEGEWGDKRIAWLNNFLSVVDNSEVQF